MTNRGSDVAITISARDRASPVMSKVSKNVTKMQGSVVSMTSSMGALSSATSGVLGPMGAMVGSFGLAGLAVTGLSVGLSLGIKKFKEMREEQKKTSQATSNLRNRLMLSGFSADQATSSVDELRSSLGRLAFQALPTLDFEMQGFIAKMDAATQTKFGDIIKTLTESLFGLAATEQQTVLVTKAVGEAFQGNFIPLNKLLGTTISTSEEFGASMLDMKSKVVSIQNPIIGALERIANGTVTLEQGTKELTGAIGADWGRAQRTFSENADIIGFLLSQMTDEERAFVEKNALNFERIGQNTDTMAARSGGAFTKIQQLLRAHVGFEKGITTALAVESAVRQRRIAVDLRTGETRLIKHTGIVADEIGAAIAHWEEVDPAVARALREAGKAYMDGAVDVGTFKNKIRIILEQARKDHVEYSTSVVREYHRIAEAADRAHNARRREATGGGSARPTPRRGGPGTARLPTPRPSVPTATPVPVRPLATGGIVKGGPILAMVGENAPDDPEVVAPLSALPGMLGGGKTIYMPIYIGGEKIHDLVINVLNDEITLREPSLGLS